MQPEFLTKCFQFFPLIIIGKQFVTCFEMYDADCSSIGVSLSLLTKEVVSAVQIILDDNVN